MAIVGAIFTRLSYRINRQGHELDREAHKLDRAGQITERFTRAIEQLGSTQIDIRLGAIYALERIARDSEDDHPQVVEVLTAYVREHARWQPSSSALDMPDKPDDQAHWNDSSMERRRPATDVQAAMTVLARRELAQDRPQARLDLIGTDLRGMALPYGEAHLEYAVGQAGFHGDLQTRILSWGEELPSHAPSEEVPRRAA